MYVYSMHGINPVRTHSKPSTNTDKMWIVNTCNEKYVFADYASIQKKYNTSQQLWFVLYFVFLCLAKGKF